MYEPHSTQEAAELYDALNETEKSVVALMRDGWLLVSDQFSCKTWLQNGDATKKLPRKVREYNEFEITLYNLLEIHSESKSKTTDGRGLVRVYWQITYRIHRYAAEAH